jgi:hypothetical protein
LINRLFTTYKYKLYKRKCKKTSRFLNFPLPNMNFISIIWCLFKVLKLLKIFFHFWIRRNYNTFFKIFEGYFQKSLKQVSTYFPWLTFCAMNWDENIKFWQPCWPNFSINKLDLDFMAIHLCAIFQDNRTFRSEVIVQTDI